MATKGPGDIRSNSRLTLRLSHISQQHTPIFDQHILIPDRSHNLHRRLQQHRILNLKKPPILREHRLPLPLRIHHQARHRPRRHTRALRLHARRLLNSRRHEARRRPTRRYGITSDCIAQSGSLQLRHDTPHEAQHAVLGDGVIGGAEALETRRRGCEHDAAGAGLLAEVVETQVGCVDAGAEVDVQDRGDGFEELVGRGGVVGGEVIGAGADTRVGEGVVDTGVFGDGCYVLGWGPLGKKGGYGLWSY